MRESGTKTLMRGARLAGLASLAVALLTVGTSHGDGIRGANGVPPRRHVSFVTDTGAALPGDTTILTIDNKQIGVGRLAAIVDVDGEPVTFEVLVSFEYTDGNGPFTGFLSLEWPDGDAVVCRYGGTVVRAASGDARWSSNIHVLDGRGSLVGATGRGTVSGFRSVAVGGAVEYAVDLTIHPRNNAPNENGSPEVANGGMSGIAFGWTRSLAVDVVLTGDPGDQRLRNAGADDAVRYGIWRIGGTGMSGPQPVEIGAVGTLAYREGSGPFDGFMVLDFGRGDVLYCRYAGHTTQFSLESTRILGRLDVLGGTGTFEDAQGAGEVRARRGGPVGSMQLTSIRLYVR